jgi:hypothetical protein
LCNVEAGPIVLKAVTEAIKRVEIGTEKTAAELAITRYQDDLRKLREQEERGIGSGIGCGMGILLLGGLMVALGQEGLGWTAAVAGAIIVGVLWYGNQKALERTQSQIRKLEGQIAEKKRIADA